MKSSSRHSKSRSSGKCPCGFVDVQAFGAKGNGKADDAPVIKQAIAALPANGGIVCFPPGIFKVGETLKFGSSVVFQGAGARATVIKSNLEAAIFQSKKPSERHYFVHFRDMKIDNTAKANANSIGIDFTNVSLGGIRNVFVTNVETGILLRRKAYYNDLFSPIIIQAITGIKMIGGANENRTFGGKIDQVRVGIIMDSVSNPQIHSTSFENFGIGIEMGPAKVASPKVIGCRFENSSPSPSGTGIAISSKTQAGIIIGPYFWNVQTVIQDNATNTNILADRNWKISGGTSVKKHLSVQQTIDFPPLSAHSTHDELIAMSGLAATDSVLATPHASIEAGLMVMGIAAAGGVRVRMANMTGAAINPQSQRFTIDVWQH
ncbi:MAG: glycosyl hydrolase family 28-related protein [bacterium]